MSHLSDEFIFEGKLAEKSLEEGINKIMKKRISNRLEELQKELKEDIEFNEKRIAVEEEIFFWRKLLETDENISEWKTILEDDTQITELQDKANTLFQLLGVKKKNRLTYLRKILSGPMRFTELL